MGLKTKILAAHRRTSATSIAHMKQSLSQIINHFHPDIVLGDLNENVGENGARHSFENLYC